MMSFRISHHTVNICLFYEHQWTRSRYAFVKSLCIDMPETCMKSPALLCRWKIDCVIISILYRECSAAIFHPFNCQDVIVKKNSCPL